MVAGATYDGEMKELYLGDHGMKVVQHGQGKQTWIDGSSYEGQWVDGLQEGDGKQKWPDVDSEYQGEWKGGMKNGNGTQ